MNTEQKLIHLVAVRLLVLVAVLAAGIWCACRDWSPGPDPLEAAARPIPGPWNKMTRAPSVLIRDRADITDPPMVPDFGPAGDQTQ